MGLSLGKRVGGWNGFWALVRNGYILSLTQDTNHFDTDW